MRWRATAVVTLALVALAGGLYFYLQGKLRLDTPREWYFIYIAGLLALALALVLTPFRRLGTILLLFAVLEVGLGVGSAALFKFGLVKTVLLPEDDYLEPPSQ